MVAGTNALTVIFCPTFHSKTELVAYTFQQHCKRTFPLFSANFSSCNISPESQCAVLISVATLTLPHVITTPWWPSCRHYRPPHRRHIPRSSHDDNCSVLRATVTQESPSYLSFPPLQHILYIYLAWIENTPREVVFFVASRIIAIVLFDIYLCLYLNI